MQRVFGGVRPEETVKLIRNISLCGKDKGEEWLVNLFCKIIMRPCSVLHGSTGGT